MAPVDGVVNAPAYPRETCPWGIDPCNSAGVNRPKRTIGGQHTLAAADGLIDEPGRGLVGMDGGCEF